MLKRNKELNFTKNDLVAIDGQKLPWFKEDLLDRGPHIRDISKLLLTTQGNFVMTVGSPWGSGKTTFVRMWKAYLESLGHPCVLFNAWENDYVDNPLLSFISEMGMQLGQMEKTGGKVKTKAYEKVWGVGKKLLPQTLSIGTRLLLGASVDYSGLFDSASPEDKANKDVADQICAAMGASAEGYAQELLSEQITTKQAVTDFKKAVKAFVKTHTRGQKVAPLFFFVDELDRCKPTYAVELLEVIKHLFDIDNIIFVLSLDREQLGHSVCAAYGEKMDAAGYLRRFIDLEYRMPEPEVSKFVNHLGDVYGLEDFSIFNQINRKDTLIRYLDTFSKIAIYYPLRTTEKAFLRGVVVLRNLQIPEDCYVQLDCVAEHVFMREINEEASKALFEGTQISAIIEKEKWDRFPIGLSSEGLNLWLEIKRRMNIGRVDLHQVVDRSSPLWDAAIYAERYRSQFGRHLIDDVYNLLDLSQHLVPQEDQNSASR